MTPSQALDDVKPTDGQAWAHFIERCESDLKAADWVPLAVHPNSPVWRSPDGKLHVGPYQAWLVMKGFEQP